jgi:4-methyl-5(b-hydroxyethyl)-thiazole monophosphate biosynthesis
VIYVFLAEGFEEIEALATVDVLRRAKIEVKTIGVDSEIIESAHNLTVVADVRDIKSDFSYLSGIVLPGGMPGVINLQTSAFVKHAIDFCVSENLLIAAICAAPSILGHMGVLNNKKVTCYPGFEQELKGATVIDQDVCRDGNILTARGPGSAIDFALEIIEYLKDEKTAQKIADDIVY